MVVELGRCHLAIVVEHLLHILAVLLCSLIVDVGCFSVNREVCIECANLLQLLYSHVWRHTTHNAGIFHVSADVVWLSIVSVLIHGSSCARIIVEVSQVAEEHETVAHLAGLCLVCQLNSHLAVFAGVSCVLYVEISTSDGCKSLGVFLVLLDRCLHD